ncbi:Aste57867_12517 [Aphanomyces stellatus]|uniref:Aste57867_12517 protein n=1 Tax=Aphanomyces stellatus TaxID=120398 RepID=A0A485KVS5_9STRA|nr:hypothetical protein As57867_012471 [Aphanomyces stellatus]VFT89368.1 Aste57867_12517 [Aphanomyces stellatus]
MSSAAASSSMYDRQMKWKRHGDKKLAYESRRLEDAQVEECTFSPQTNKHDVKRVIECGKLAAKSEVHAMQAHIARQQKARVQSDIHVKKQLFVSTGKNFDEVTEVKPFRLSQGNKTRRDAVTIGKPMLRPQSASPSRSTHMQHTPTPQQPEHSDDLDKQVQDLLDNNKPSDGPWERERASLIGIIEAQRHEIKAREKAHGDAAKIADKFAAAVLAFEERIVAVESRANVEMAEVRKAMERQHATMQLILQGLSIHAPDDPKAAAAARQNSVQQLLFRKEYEKSNV